MAGPQLRPGKQATSLPELARTERTHMSSTFVLRGADSFFMEQDTQHPCACFRLAFFRRKVNVKTDADSDIGVTTACGRIVPASFLRTSGSEVTVSSEALA